MKYYEFVVIKDGILVYSCNRKQDAVASAEKFHTKYPGSKINIKAHVYGKPLDTWDVGDYYLYSYDVQ